LYILWMQVEVAKAGDKVVFTGCLVVVPDVGSMGRIAGQVTIKSGGWWAGIQLHRSNRRPGG
jgi:hypothetical protein